LRSETWGKRGSGESGRRSSGSPISSPDSGEGSRIGGRSDRCRSLEDLKGELGPAILRVVVKGGGGEGGVVDWFVYLRFEGCWDI
jgi:hypothetical protein